MLFSDNKHERIECEVEFYYLKTSERLVLIALFLFVDITGHGLHLLTHSLKSEIQSPKISV